MKLEDVNCYICGSLKSTFYDSENGFKLNKCSDCGLVYLSPRPSVEERLPSAIIGEHKGNNTINVTGKFNNNKLFRYEKIIKYFFSNNFRNNEKWLDIGCGHGEFLLALRKYSQGMLLCKGCEPNRNKIINAKKFGLDVSFFDLNSHTEKYDYISLLNVFSHLSDPIESLMNWKKLLNKGGILFLETGHSSHLKPKHHHKPYYLPDHLSFANKKILINILKKAGFKIEKIHIYRYTKFPELKFKPVFKEFINFILSRENKLRCFFPHCPNRDMYIKAVLQ